MKNLAKIRDEHEGAFTLVELLVVILIIGILAAIAIPAFLNQRKAAVDSSVESDVKNASTQIETWSVSNPRADVPALVIVGSDTGTTVEYDDPAADPVSDVVLNGIEVGEGTRVIVQSTGNTGEYLILGVNEDGNRAAGDELVPADLDASITTDDGILFDSTKGGLQ